jgi:hypothetical protein
VEAGGEQRPFEGGGIRGRSGLEHVATAEAHEEAAVRGEGKIPDLRGSTFGKSDVFQFVDVRPGSAAGGQ